jgi:hypothetical protein
MPTFQDFMDSRPELHELPRAEQYAEYDAYIQDIMDHIRD